MGGKLCAVDMRFCPPIPAILTGLLATIASLASQKTTISFNRDVRPIFSEHCSSCHGPDAGARKAKLRLDTPAGALAALREGGHAIKPGKPEQSVLLHRIESNDPKFRMPPAESGPALTTAQIQTLSTWIAEGAKFEPHWSYIKTSRHPLPRTQNKSWPLNPIDHFILAEIERCELKTSPEADPRTLVRRLATDLTGLPPADEDLAHLTEAAAKGAFAFEHAYTRYVERLLASPAHAERLAVHWLDLVRYADTMGYHGDQPRSLSPYRDWVIEAFSQNMPFDQFTTEQLAGDLLPQATLSQQVASSYNRLNRASAEGGVQPREYLSKYAADRVRTMGSIWLGSTVGCAECHDHKFDPYTTKDFYRFASFFADIKELGIVPGAKHIELLSVPTADQQKEVRRLSEQLAGAQKTLEAKTPSLLGSFERWQKEIRSESQRWRLLTPSAAKSQSGATLTIASDGSIAASGKNPLKDLYTFVVKSDLTALQGIRLECLTDESLPAKGPGRASNGNFVITGIDVSIGGKKLEWVRSKSPFSQKQFLAEHLAKGNKKGWAVLPQMGRNHRLTLTTKEPATLARDSAGASQFVITIAQAHGTRHTLGRFRLHGTATAPDQPAAELLSPDFIELLAVDPAQRSAPQKNQLWAHFREQTSALAKTRATIKSTREARARLEKAITTTLATKATKPRVMRVLARGDWMDDSGEVVQPGFPSFLPAPQASDRLLTRLDLARWLTTPDHPLVARTCMNRLWKMFHGIGLSKTLDDLGSQGDWPRHLALLDWLATEFIDSGWDLRHMIRMLVTSRTYRQSSQLREDLQEIDPYNQLHARQSIWRIEAEFIRDRALAISGLLSREIGGPSVKPYQPAGYWKELNFPKRKYASDTGTAQFRRGLYTHWQRSFLHPSMAAFDAPSRDECTASRAISNTPQQALALLNDPSHVESARAFAARLLAESGDFHGRLARAFHMALSRPPRSFEVTRLKKLFDIQLQRYTKDPAAARALTAVGISSNPEHIDPVQHAAWTSITRTILNLHEGITRY